MGWAGSDEPKMAAGWGLRNLRMRTRDDRRASQNREWFEYRHTWGANVGSRELHAAPWLTRDPGGAIHRGLAFYASYRNSLRVQWAAGCGSLFADRHTRTSV
jgi:hypothetical protein